MARSRSSSKRKSSKKKSLKVSSEARRKKRSSRNKSKKLRHRDDYISSYSENESSSSSLISSSSSEGDYRSRKARSRTRDDAKGGRKRTRRRSSSREGSDDSPPVRKRKRSKKKDDSEARKKRQKTRSKKRKLRRDASFSSASSDSESCSTCRGADNSDERAEYERPRGRSREKKKDQRDSIKSRHGSRKTRNRSTSRSSSSKSNDSYGNDSTEKLVVENNSRRLKSIITVVTQPEDQEGLEMNKDELKEEIVYDYDDYPSCRSNDSNDGGNKREVIDYSNVSSDKRTVEGVVGDVNSVATLKVIEPISPIKNDRDEHVASKGKESNDSGDVGPAGDNLELILRQKALENLSRFRGALQRKAVVAVDKRESESGSGGGKQLPTAKIDDIQSPREVPASREDVSMVGAAQPAIPRSRFTWRRDPSVPTRKEEKAATCSSADSGRTKARLVKLQNSNPSLPSTVLNKSAGETSKTEVNANADISVVGTSDAHGSTTALETPSCVSTEESSSKEQQTETKDSSQFEQKTMSVMRGGEMVQVSYKVYIPKKAPALSRRRLKR